MKKKEPSRRTPLSRKIGTTLAACLLLAAAVYGGNNRIDTTEYTYSSQNLPIAFDGYRIVHLSDLHSKTFGKDNEPFMEKLRTLSPDIIVATGDMVDGSTHTDISASLLFMQQITEVAPVYYVTGNHEMRLSKADREQFLSDITAAGVKVLANETIEIGAADSGLTMSLIGTGDESLQANILQTLAQDAEGTFRLLLAHEPQFLESHYTETGVDLIFSGHAHGGQWRIPFTHQGLYAPDQGFLPALTEGMVSTGTGTTMVISRGLGNSAFPVRIFNHPEIVCVTLRVQRGG